MPSIITLAADAYGRGGTELEVEDKAKDVAAHISNRMAREVTLTNGEKLYVSPRWIVSIRELR